MTLHLMSRGLGSNERAILAALDKNGGQASTKFLLESVGFKGFYRPLNSLLRKGKISWYKSHGGPGSTPGLVSITRKNVLLIDVDSKIMTLPLIKLSAWHKKQNHNVVLHRGLTISSTIDKPDVVYISCLFTKNRAAARRLAKQFPDAEIRIGGTGINLTTELPQEIEHQMPDYDLYPDCNYSLGYTVRGCFRECPWCVVPKKEGKPHPVADIYEFYNPKFKRMVVLDNNILALPSHFRKIARQIIKEKIEPEFNAGLDVRLLDDEKAKLLKQMRISQPKFAWDDLKDEYMVMRGIEILRKHGINRSLFYVLVGYNSTMEEDLYRLEKLKAVGQRAYVMRYETVRSNKEYIYLAAWANQPQFFETMSFDEYKMKCKAREENRNNVPILEV